MHWTGFFPILTDEQLSSSACLGDQERLDDWFGVQEIFNAQPEAKHLVSVSLFWKNVDVEDADLPMPTEELLRNAAALGMVKRFAPWEHYVKPVLRGAAELRRTRPHVVVVVWLAADLHFLVPHLIGAGCEVRLMKSSSLRHNPGALWRCLAFEEDRLVTMVDSDGVDRCGYALDRTEHLVATGHTAWRMLTGDEENLNDAGHLIYKPIVALGCGSREPLPARQLLEAFLWHCLKGTFPNRVRLPWLGEVPIFGTQWPGYGFDEWFLACAIYPRWAAGGLVTYLDHPPKGFVYGLDMDYASSMNPEHTIVMPGEGPPCPGAKAYEGDREGWGLF